MSTTLSITELNKVINNQTVVDALTIEKGKNYNWALGKIKFIPTNINQAKSQIKFIKNGGYDNLLMCGEWVSLEKFLNYNGFKGEYKLTKSGSMCRIENIEDYVSAIKKQFSL